MSENVHPATTISVPVFLDGSYKEETSGAFATYCHDGSVPNYSVRMRQAGSDSFKSELEAAIWTLTCLMDQRTLQTHRIVIFSDCKYLVKELQWYQKVANGMDVEADQGETTVTTDDQPVDKEKEKMKKQYEDFCATYKQEMTIIYKLAKAHPRGVSLVHIPGHSGWLQNHIVDYMAKSPIFPRERLLDGSQSTHNMDRLLGYRGLYVVNIAHDGSSLLTRQEAEAMWDMCDSWTAIRIVRSRETDWISSGLRRTCKELDVEVVLSYLHRPEEFPGWETLMQQHGRL